MRRGRNSCSSRFFENHLVGQFKFTVERIQTESNSVEYEVKGQVFENMEKEKDQKRAEVIMKKRNIYFKLRYCIFVYAIFLTGCSKERSTEERIVVEDVKEEAEDEKKERRMKKRSVRKWNQAMSP